MKQIKSLIAGVSALLGATTLWADAMPDPVNGVVTLDVEAGVTNTYAALPASATQLVKTGAGGAILATASSAGACPVEIQAGTLILQNKEALGSSGDIVVKSGATLHTNFAGSKQSEIQITRPVHITGTGVNGLGAIRHTNPTKSAATEDSIFGELQLDGNATVEVAHRWGVRNLYLNNNTITRKGTAEWAFYKTKPQTPGTIANTTGTLLLQDTLAFPKDAGDSTLTMSGGSLSVYAINVPLNLTVNMSGGNVIWGSNGATTNQNFVTGDIHIKKSNSVIKSKVLNVKGNFITDGSYSTYFQGDATKAQGYGLTYFRDGSTATNFRPCLQNHMLVFENGSTIDCNMIRVGNTDTAGANMGSVRQTGAEVSLATDVAYVGEKYNSYGAWALESGTLTCNYNAGTSTKASWYVGRYATTDQQSVGMIVQKGGLFEAPGVATNSFITLGESGIGYYVQTGGTHDFTNQLGPQKDRVRLGNLGGTGVLSVSGKDTEFKTAQLVVGSTSAYSPHAVIAVTDGATLEASRLQVNHSTTAANDAAATSYCYFAGGILRPSWYAGFNNVGISTDTFASRNPNHVVLGKGGLTIDTSAARQTVEGEVADNVQIPWALETPAGRGLASITLPDYSSLAAVDQRYMGAVPLIIEGTGYGAAAYADYDYDTGKLTPVILSPGCNYDDTTKVYLPYASYPDGSSDHRLECTYTLADNDLTGGLTVKGTVPLYMRSDNTYQGATVIEAGATLRAYGANVVPAATALTVKKGGTLVYNPEEATGLAVSTLAGAGTIANYNVTVSQGLVVTAAELFEDKEPLKVSKTLAFAAGATVTIADPENLETYRRANKVTCLVAEGGISGTPTFVRPEGLSDQWRFTQTATTLKFGCNYGSVVLIR